MQVMFLFYVKHEEFGTCEETQKQSVFSTSFLIILVKKYELMIHGLILSFNHKILNINCKFKWKWKTSWPEYLCVDTRDPCKQVWKDIVCSQYRCKRRDVPLVLFLVLWWEVVLKCLVCEITFGTQKMPIVWDILFRSFLWVKNLLEWRSLKAKAQSEK